MKNFLVTTTPLLDGIKIKQYLGVVNANVVIGANFFADFAASLTDFFGGNSGAYQKRMNEMYDAAIKQLKRKATLLGANAIVSLSVDFDELSGKGKSMFMLNATGTACIIESNIESSDAESMALVSEDDIQILLKRKHIIESLSKRTYINQEQWNEMLTHPSAEFLPFILKDYYPEYQSDPNYSVSTSSVEETNKLVSALQEDEVIPIVYDLYPQNQHIANIIVKFELFDPKSVLKLMDIDFHLVLNILNASKSYYSENDVSLMEDLLTRFDNLPKLSQTTKGKKGLFGKEEELIICPNGHKRSASNNEQYCPNCGCDDYGLTKNDRKRIKEFSEKLDVIKQQLEMTEKMDSMK